MFNVLCNCKIYKYCCRAQNVAWKIVTKTIKQVNLAFFLYCLVGERSTLYRSYDENKNLKTFPDVLKYARKNFEITSLTHGQEIDEDMAKKIMKLVRLVFHLTE